MDRQTIEISLEDVGNLRRMHAQQFKRLTDAHAANDGPMAGRAMRDIVTCHRACADLFDVVEYLLSTRGETTP